MNRSINDVAEFSQIMIDSGLVADESALVHFRRGIITANGIEESITGFTKYLVTNDILTCWQCAKLRDGKHKGFFIDSLRILDQLGCDDDSDCYLARDENTHRHVKMHVQRPNRKQGRTSGIMYTVEDYP